jgi:hypothetical protein
VRIPGGVCALRVLDAVRIVGAVRVLWGIWVLWGIRARRAAGGRLLRLVRRPVALR